MEKLKATIKIKLFLKNSFSCRCNLGVHPLEKRKTSAFYNSYIGIDKTQKNAPFFLNEKKMLS